MPFQAEPGEPIQHHYVSRSYLAPFTREGTTKRGHVWVYGRDAAQPPTREPLRKVAFEPNLYTVLDENGNPSSALERRLARDIEEPFLAWRRGIVCARRGQAPAMLERMTPQQLATVARYILYQHLRTPAQRIFAARLAEISHRAHWTDPATLVACGELYRAVRPSARLSLTWNERELDFAAWMAALQVYVRGIVDADLQRWLRPIDRFADALVPRLVDELTWRLVELPSDVADELPLITCDNPVVLARSRAEPAPDVQPGWDVRIGGGWGEPSIQMTLALSPRHTLMIAGNPEALKLADDPARFAASVRVRTARHALLHAYARDNDPRIAELMRATRAPDVVFEVNDELIPGTVDARELFGRIARAGVTKIGVRYSD